MVQSTFVLPPNPSGSVIRSVQFVTGVVADPQEASRDETLPSICSSRTSSTVDEFGSVGSVLLSREALNTSAGSPSSAPMLSSRRAVAMAGEENMPRALLSHSLIAHDASNCNVVVLVMLK